MKRVGPRGSGKWEEISWEEAVAELAAKIRASGGQTVLDLGRPDPLVPSLLPLLKINRVATDVSTASWGARSARKALLGSEDAVADTARAQSILLIGAQPLDGGDDFARAAAELTSARAAGVKIVLVSPRAGSTGSYADRWIPCRPGGEAKAALALARAVFDAGLARPSALRDAFGLTGEEVSAALPTAEKAAEKAGLKSADVAYLVDLFRRGQVACRADGSGLKAGRALEGAAALLNVLGGNSMLRASAPTGLEIRATAPREKYTGQLMNGQLAGGVYFAYRANPVYEAPGGEKLAKAFADERKAAFVVSFDTILTETGMVADLVLPAATDLECWNVFQGRTPDGGAGYALQRPVHVWEAESELLRSKEAALERLFDGPAPGAVAGARQLGDVLAEVASALGSAPQVKKCAEAARAVSAKLGIDEKKGWALSKAEQAPLKADGALLVKYLRTAEAGGAENAGALTLVPMTYTELDRGNANSMIGREIRHESVLFINSATAKRLSLAKGDRALVKMGAEEAHVEVFPLETLHPAAAAFPFGFGHRASGQAASARPASEVYAEPERNRKEFLRAAMRSPFGAGPAVKDVWWREMGPGTSLAALAEPETDEEGAPLWRELSVHVKKA